MKNTLAVRQPQNQANLLTTKLVEGGHLNQAAKRVQREQIGEYARQMAPKQLPVQNFTIEIENAAAGGAAAQTAVLFNANGTITGESDGGDITTTVVGGGVTYANLVKMSATNPIIVSGFQYYAPSTPLQFSQSFTYYMGQLGQTNPFAYNVSNQITRSRDPKNQQDDLLNVEFPEPFVFDGNTALVVSVRANLTIQLVFDVVQQYGVIY